MPAPAPVLTAHPAGMQRAAGEARITVETRGGDTHLARLHQAGQAKIRLPRVHGGVHVEAVLINVSGGMTGGDRFTWTADAAENARLTVTTQACEKLYRASSGVARSHARISAGAGAQVAWLPQEAILFDGSAYERILDADIAADGRLLVLESAVLGRAAMGETVSQVRLRDRWRICAGGVLVHAEETLFTGDPAKTAAGPARLGGMTAFAGLVLIAPDAGLHAGALKALAPVAGAVWGVSHVPVGAGLAGRHAFTGGKLVARFAARDGLALRRALIPAVEVLMRGALGIDGLPKVWRL
jgi:urease accessory protein